MIFQVNSNCRNSLWSTVRTSNLHQCFSEAPQIHLMYMSCVRSSFCLAIHSLTRMLLLLDINLVDLYLRWCIGGTWNFACRLWQSWRLVLTLNLILPCCTSMPDNTCWQNTYSTSAVYAYIHWFYSSDWAPLRHELHEACLPVCPHQLEVIHS